MSEPVQRGTVTSLTPFRVQLDGIDEAGLPCQRLDFPAAITDKVAVLVTATQRLAIGRYPTEA